MEKQAPIRLAVATPLTVRKHMLKRLLLLFEQLLQRPKLVANISQLQQRRDIVSYLFLELPALKLVPLLHATGIFPCALFVGRRAKAFGAKILEGDCHLFDQYANGLFEDAEYFEVSVGGALEEERYGVESY
jgi:hypothetical protein